VQFQPSPWITALRSETEALCSLVAANRALSADSGNQHVLGALFTRARIGPAAPTGQVNLASDVCHATSKLALLPPVQRTETGANPAATSLYRSASNQSRRFVLELKNDLVVRQAASATNQCRQTISVVITVFQVTLFVRKFRPARVRLVHVQLASRRLVTSNRSRLNRRESGRKNRPQPTGSEDVVDLEIEGGCAAANQSI